MNHNNDALRQVRVESGWFKLVTPCIINSQGSRMLRALRIIYHSSGSFLDQFPPQTRRAGSSHRENIPRLGNPHGPARTWLVTAIDHVCLSHSLQVPHCGLPLPPLSTMLDPKKQQQFYITLTEPVAFLRTPDPSGRLQPDPDDPPTIVRGLLTLNVVKPVGISSVEAELSGMLAISHQEGSCCLDLSHPLCASTDAHNVHSYHPMDYSVL